jgi:hypothetical protein
VLSDKQQRFLDEEFDTRENSWICVLHADAMGAMKEVDRNGPMAEEVPSKFRSSAPTAQAEARCC